MTIHLDTPSLSFADHCDSRPERRHEKLDIRPTGVPAGISTKSFQERSVEHIKPHIKPMGLDYEIRADVKVEFGPKEPKVEVSGSAKASDGRNSIEVRGYRDSDGKGDIVSSARSSSGSDSNRSSSNRSGKK